MLWTRDPFLKVWRPVVPHVADCAGDPFVAQATFEAGGATWPPVRAQGRAGIWKWGHRMHIERGLKNDTHANSSERCFLWTSEATTVALTTRRDKTSRGSPNICFLQFLSATAPYTAVKGSQAASSACRNHIERQMQHPRTGHT